MVSLRMGFEERGVKVIEKWEIDTSYYKRKFIIKATLLSLMLLITAVLTFSLWQQGSESVQFRFTALLTVLFLVLTVRSTVLAYRSFKSLDKESMLLFDGTSYRYTLPGKATKIINVSDIHAINSLYIGANPTFIIGHMGLSLRDFIFKRGFTEVVLTRYEGESILGHYRLNSGCFA